MNREQLEQGLKQAEEFLAAALDALDGPMPDSDWYDLLDLVDEAHAAVRDARQVLESC